MDTSTCPVCFKEGGLRFTGTGAGRIAVFSANALLDTILPGMSGRFLYGAYERAGGTET